MTENSLSSASSETSAVWVCSFCCFLSLLHFYNVINTENKCYERNGEKRRRLCSQGLINAMISVAEYIQEFCSNALKLILLLSKVGFTILQSKVKTTHKFHLPIAYQENQILIVVTQAKLIFLTFRKVSNFSSLQHRECHKYHNH